MYRRRVEEAQVTPQRMKPRDIALDADQCASLFRPETTKYLASYTNLRNGLSPVIERGGGECDVLEVTFAGAHKPDERRTSEGEALGRDRDRVGPPTGTGGVNLEERSSLLH